MKRLFSLMLALALAFMACAVAEVAEPTLDAADIVLAEAAADAPKTGEDPALDDAELYVESLEAEAVETEVSFGLEAETEPAEETEAASSADGMLPGPEAQGNVPAEPTEEAWPAPAQMEFSADAEPARPDDVAAQAEEADTRASDAAVQPAEATDAVQPEDATAPAEDVYALPEVTVNAKKIPVLTYHMVLSDDQKASSRFARDRYSVSVSTFDRQMAWLRQRNYTAITCEQLYLWHTGQLKLPEKSVLITLDDGYEVTVDNIIPILEKYGLRATEFIIGAYSYEGRTGFVSYDRMREIQSQHRCMEFQSHTWALHRKNAYKKEKYAAFAADAARQAEVYGFEYIAYPYGKNSKAMRKAYRANGIRMAFLFGSSHNGYATRKQSLMKIRRIEVTGGMSLKKFKRWCK